MTTQGIGRLTGGVGYAAAFYNTRLLKSRNATVEAGSVGALLKNTQNTQTATAGPDVFSWYFFPAAAPSGNIIPRSATLSVSFTTTATTRRRRQRSSNLTISFTASGQRTKRATRSADLTTSFLNTGVGLRKLRRSASLPINFSMTADAASGTVKRSASNTLTFSLNAVHRVLKRRSASLNLSFTTTALVRRKRTRSADLNLSFASNVPSGAKRRRSATGAIIFSTLANANHISVGGPGTGGSSVQQIIRRRRRNYRFDRRR